MRASAYSLPLPSPFHLHLFIYLRYPRRFSLAILSECSHPYSCPPHFLFTKVLFLFSAYFSPTNKARQELVLQPQLPFLSFRLPPSLLLLPHFRLPHFSLPFFLFESGKVLTRSHPLALLSAHRASNPEPICTFPQISSAVLRQLGISVPGR